MKVFVGADHRGVEFKKKVVAALKKHKYSVFDEGTNDPDTSCDYPIVAYKVAKNVAKSKNNKGILLGMSGIGQAIAANKVRGAYAALCYNVQVAELSRQHNNANILVLSAKFIKPKDIEKVVIKWLNTPFEGGRHQRRFNQIRKIERGQKP